MKVNIINHIIYAWCTIIVLPLAIKGIDTPSTSIFSTKPFHNKRFNQVCFPAAHNANSCQESAVQNQDICVAQQLRAGIRALKVHVWHDKAPNGTASIRVCHGMKKDFLEKDYLQQVLQKIPILFRPFAKKVLKKLEPINDIVRTACKKAYGTDDTPGPLPFPHCVFDPSAQDLSDFLHDIHNFVQQNRQEVITVILEDHTRSLNAIAKHIKEAGLDRYAHTQDRNAPWPTLATLVKKGTTVVFLIHGDEDLSYDDYPWLHYIWDFAWDTEWDFAAVSALKEVKKSCLPKRGLQSYRQRHNYPHNKLSIVYHFITEGMGGVKHKAQRANRYPLLRYRLKQFKEMHGCIPTIVQVDFFQSPNNDLFAAVNEINATTNVNQNACNKQ